MIAALVPQVEVTFIMPSQTPGKENSGGDLESVVPDTSSMTDDIGGSSTIWQHPSRADYSNRRMNTSNDIPTPQSDTSGVLGVDFGALNNSGTISQTPVVTFKQHNGQENEPKIMPNINDKQWVKSVPEIEKPKLMKVDSMSGIIPNNFNVNLSSMKKGFSNFMTSLDSALKPSPEDGSDTVSMQSDVSSDSENYVVVSLEDQEKMDAAFNVEGSIRISTVEEASEVVEETPDTQSEKSMDSVCKRKDLVSSTQVITYR